MNKHNQHYDRAVWIECKHDALWQSKLRHTAYRERTKAAAQARRATPMADAAAAPRCPARGRRAARDPRLSRRRQARPP
jgi:hypothetical protein